MAERSDDHSSIYDLSVRLLRGLSQKRPARTEYVRGLSSAVTPEQTAIQGNDEGKRKAQNALQELASYQVEVQRILEWSLRAEVAPLKPFGHGSTHHKKHTAGCWKQPARHISGMARLQTPPATLCSPFKHDTTGWHPQSRRILRTSMQRLVPLGNTFGMG